MKLRSLLIAIAMLSFTSISANVFNGAIPPSPLITQDKTFREAYYDTLSILNGSNECSEFFGGSSKSVVVFDDLMARVNKEMFPSSIGIRMSGPITNVSSLTTKTKYRLFDKVSINYNGPFYRHRSSDSQPSINGVGTFPANTREVRVLMLLHELGHVVEADGKWLLPDDGLDADLSRSNTRKVENVCGSQIRSLGKGDMGMNAVGGKETDVQTTSLETKP